MLLDVLQDGLYNLIIRLLGERRTLDDECLWNLAGVVVRNLNDRAIGYCGVREKMGLELGGCYLMAWTRMSVLVSLPYTQEKCDIIPLTLISSLILSTITICSAPDGAKVTIASSPVRTHLPSSS